MRGYILIACALIAESVFAAVPAGAGSWAEGPWSGAIVRHNAVQMIEVTIEETPDGLAGSYAIPDLCLYDEPLREVSADDTTLALRILYGPFMLQRHDAVEELTGGNARWNPPLAMHLKRLAVAPAPWVVRDDLTIPVGNVTLAATLYLPANGGPFPAVVVVPGSGDQSRADWHLRAHAYALVRNGIACLIYDKRGVGGSTGSYEDATFDELARDANAAARVLRARRDIRANAVGLMGISQGGWIATIAAHHDPPPDFVIYVEGPSRSLFDQELDRVRYTMTADGATPTSVDSAIAYTRAYLALASGRRDRRAEFDRLGAAARDASWAGYVSLPDSSLDDDLRWWHDNDYDPAHDLSTLAVPALVILGENDPVVPPAENRPRFERLLGEAGVAHRIEVVPGLYHAAATYHRLIGGAWDWPRAFWSWSRRPPQLDTVLGPWVLTTTATR